MTTTATDCEIWRYPHRQLPAKVILGVVGEAFGFTEAELIGRCRYGRLAWARQVFMWLSVSFFGHTKTAIAHMLNRECRETIGYGANKVKAMVSVYPKLAQDLQVLVDACTALLDKPQQATVPMTWRQGKEMGIRIERLR